MQILGRHLIVEYVDCDRAVLDDLSSLEKSMTQAVRLSGATIVKSSFHRYNPQGVSGVVVIAESHMSIHTWPEYGYAAVDFFTCGEECDPSLAHEYMVKALRCKSSEVKELERGIPSRRHERIKHKQVAQPDSMRVANR